MLLPVLVAFQLAAEQPAVFNGLKGHISATPPRIDTTITIDGRLDEPVWSRAAILNGFSEYAPADQRPAPDSTEVLVWYSPTALYFGIRAFEAHGVVRATLADRDNIGNDDNVEIYIDAFREGRKAVVFIVNPLGVQGDGTRNEGGGFTPGSNVAPGQDDLSADFQWESKGRLTDFGYEVEIRIPFSSLRYPIEKDHHWGLQIDRHTQHNGYEETWTPVLKASASFIAQEGELRGITGITHGQVLDINPELTDAVAGNPPTTGTAWSYTSAPRLGGNVRWGIGSNFVLNGTFRPDFSQVEADATQIATDTRFALFYPEKRPFFVEQSELFNVPNTLVYTRQVVQPDEALKLTGKLGDNDIAVLSTTDAGSAVTPDGAHPLVDIVRLQRDIGPQSTAGLLYTDRIGGGRDNTLGGGDVHLTFDKLYYAQFQAVMSSTTDGGSTVAGPMWEAVVDRTGRAFGFHYNILGVHPDFQDDNGFVTRTGIVQPGIFNRFSWYGQAGAWLEQFSAFFHQQGTWRYDDFFAGRNVLEQNYSVSGTFIVRGGWSMSVAPSLGIYAFDPVAYDTLRTVSANGTIAPFVPPGRRTNDLFSLSISTPQYPRFSASAGTTVGTDIDFYETSLAHRTDYSLALNLRPDDRLRVSATYLSSTFTRLSDGVRVNATRIPRLAVEYQLTRPLFVRVVAQYTATALAPIVDPATARVLLVPDSTGGFTPSVQQNSNMLRVDFLLSYQPSPGTVFFAGYGNSLMENDPLAFRQLTRISDGFFVKVSYLFRGVGVKD
jgi:Domain of unknown function (DUF5916)